MIIMSPHRFKISEPPPPAGPEPYLYYIWNITEWVNGTNPTGVAEIAVYDNLDNLSNLGTGSGQLNVHNSTGTATGMENPYANLEDFRAAAGIVSSAQRWACQGFVRPAWWRFVFDTLPDNPVLGYTIWSSSVSNRYPEDFTVSGSQDGVTWVGLDVQTGQSVGGSFTPKDYTL